MSDLIERLRSAPNAYAGYVMHEDGVIPADGRLMHEAADEIERLAAELETERMRLTACGVAALANTADSAARARDIRPEYRSASLDDVERAVDREIQLRDERDELRRKLAAAPAAPQAEPKREALSDDEILDTATAAGLRFSMYSDDVETRAAIKRLARAIEREHGIGGSDE